MESHKWLRRIALAFTFISYNLCHSDRHSEFVRKQYSKMETASVALLTLEDAASGNAD
jgi:hypothetical protein